MDPSKLINSLLYQAFTGNAATRFGQEQERILERKYRAKHGEVNRITHLGLSTHKNHHFLGGSPDGIASSSNGTSYLLEYKNPYVLETDKLTPLEGATSRRISFLSFDKSLPSVSSLQLKKTHDYFYQVQGLLEIFDLPFCHFVVGGWNSFVVLTVQRDHEFFNSVMLPKLRSFYFGAVLPELAYPMKRRTVNGSTRTVAIDWESVDWDDF